MHCDADAANLQQFEVYLGQQQNSEFGLEYDVLMRLCKDISEKNHHVYCDNLSQYAILPTIINNMKLLINFSIFGKFP